MKHQALFSSTDKSKKKKKSPAASLLGALRVKDFLRIPAFPDRKIAVCQRET